MTDTASSQSRPHSKSIVFQTLRVFSKLGGACLILGVKFYQITLGPFLGGHCRFQPSCSYYFIEAVKKHGPLKGACKGVWRICRCHPFHPGGYDPP